VISSSQKERQRNYSYVHLLPDLEKLGNEYFLISKKARIWAYNTTSENFEYYSLDTISKIESFQVIENESVSATSGGNGLGRAIVEVYYLVLWVLLLVP